MVDREAGLADAARVLEGATQVQKIRIVFRFTGSVSPVRTQRSTFTSIAPLQVIDAKLEREFGRLEMMNVFQKATCANELQADSSTVNQKVLSKQ